MDILTVNELQEAFKVLLEYDTETLSEGWGLSFVVMADQPKSAPYKTIPKFKEVTAEIQDGKWIILNNVKYG